MFLFSLVILLTMVTGAPVPNAVAAERCAPWVAQIASLQGEVATRNAGETQWRRVQIRQTFCPGDVIQVGEQSRAALVLRNDTVLRLDQHTTVTFAAPKTERTFLLHLLSGAAYFFNRIPRSLEVITPFVNAAAEGTEFFVKVESAQTLLSVFAGRVAATNTRGSLTLVSGQSAVATAAQTPTLQVVVHPRDAVQWALYYPPVLDLRASDFSEAVAWQAILRRSWQFYLAGDLQGAFASLADVPQDSGDARFFTYRAVLLLTVGRVDEAQGAINRALQLDPHHSAAVVLQALIAVVQNRQEEALQLARHAIDLDAKSAAARVVLSYAQQAGFNLQGALASLQEAVQLSPQNALAWARLAEIWLSVGNRRKAVAAAQQATVLQAELAHTQTVLGFAFLAQIETAQAQDAFTRAIARDQAAPLPRLGLGLAKIQQGELKTGRGDIEIAAALDPNNALIRSYLGKAYVEEKRDKLAAEQFAMAKELDPFDPTPWFYDAIRKQTVNRPVEALHDLQKSIQLNDNRAVYRSRLLLDADLAIRSASRARIYGDLGFQQLALVEGWKSLHIDPGNYAAHRFLADVYSARPRHEIARVSELLQSQLLQPINLTPIQPQLAESELFILAGAGPSDAAFNEFNPLFNRNRLALQVSGVAGNHNTLGDDLVHSGVSDTLSYSLGQFHFETDGFRDNNDVRQNIYTVFAQAQLSPEVSLQAEYRRTDTENGDVSLRFDPDVFSRTLRQEIDSNTFRLGLRYAPSVSADVIASVILRDREESQRSMDPAAPFDTVATFSDLQQKTYSIEAQYLWRAERWNLVAGGGHLAGETTFDFRSELILGPVVLPGPAAMTDADVQHTNAYAYAQIHFPVRVIWTLGASGDFFASTDFDRNQFNPKVGVMWHPIPSMTIRAAAFRVLKRELITNQTIEPTQVAGFNQFFDDVNGTDAWRYGVAIDQKLSASLFAGVELSKRDLDVPIRDIDLTVSRKEAHDEQLHRAYLYWAPHARLALSAEYQFEELERDGVPEALDVTQLTPGRVRTHRLPFALNAYHPNGLFARLQATYVDHEVAFSNLMGGTDVDEDRFWVVDLSVGYRLPQRFGILSLSVKNLFDERFKFQDTDLAGEPRIPSLQPARFIFARLTLAF